MILSPRGYVVTVQTTNHIWFAARLLERSTVMPIKLEGCPTQRRGEELVAYSTKEAVEDFLVSEYEIDRNDAMKATAAAMEDDPGRFDVRSVDDLAEWVYASSKFWDVK